MSCSTIVYNDIKLHKIVSSYSYNPQLISAIIVYVILYTLLNCISQVSSSGKHQAESSLQWIEEYFEENCNSSRTILIMEKSNLAPVELLDQLKE